MSTKSLVLAVVIVVVLLTPPVWGQVGFRATMVIQGTRTVAAQEIQFPLFRNQFTALILEIAPGGQVGRHLHPVPMLAYVLEGSVTVEMEGQTPMTFRQGQAYLEAVNSWHNAVNPGSTTTKLLVVFAGEEGKPVLVRP
jgi:quercetin dioxygenase-like cupin family protein